MRDAYRDTMIKQRTGLPTGRTPGIWTQARYSLIFSTLKDNLYGHHFISFME